MFSNYWTRLSKILWFVSGEQINHDLPKPKGVAPGGFLGVGAGGAHPPPPRDDLRFSNTTGIVQKKLCGLWVIGVEAEKETSSPPPQKNPGSAPEANSASANDWSARHWQITIFCHNRVQGLFYHSTTEFIFYGISSGSEAICIIFTQARSQVGEKRGFIYA